jgi:hypothetical protein
MKQAIDQMRQRYWDQEQTIEHAKRDYSQQE